MIHLVDHRNYHLYLDQFSDLAVAASTRFFGLAAWPGLDYQDTDLADRRFSYALELNADRKVAECLQTCRIGEAPFLEQAAALAGRDALDGVWVCAPLHEPQRTPRHPWRASPQAWIGLLENAARQGDRQVMTLVDQWHYALSLKLGMPWRKVATTGERFVLAAMDIDLALVRRLASRFHVPTPCAYRVEDADLRAWGSLERIQEEFTTLQRLMIPQRDSPRALPG